MGESLILRFYQFFNGQPVAIEQLLDYRKKVEQYIDAIGSGEYVPKLSAIKTSVTQTIKNLQAQGVTDIEKMELVNDPKPTLAGPRGYVPPPPAAFAAMQKNGTLWPSKRTNPFAKNELTKNVKTKVVEVKPDNIVAEELPIAEIHTDTKRFQNRQGAFSEASAQSVAENFDPNKFDPIVVWRDPKAKKLFVLSGHSRYEGMKRRKSKTIAVRYFTGTEEKAIQFAKVEANRAANQENLIEDLAAYKLMRDGDKARGISKATKGELQRIFKGKSSKLESYSYLSDKGLFVQALNQSTTSNYPYLERNAQWVGILRNQYPVISNQGEDNIFHFFYSDKSGKNIKLSKDEFFALAKKKINLLRKGESVLFPECSSEGCKQTVDRENDTQKGESFKRLREINEQLESITEKLTSKDATVRVTTDEEKKYLRTVADKLQQEKERINRDLDLIDKSQASLFGLPHELYGIECGCPDGEENAGLGFTKDGQNKIYDMITNMILKIMKEGKELPWQKPWAIDSILATNLKSKKPYKGANMFLLNLIAPMFFGKTGPYWLTYKQAQELGGNVKKGASGFPVIYYSTYYTVNRPKKQTLTEDEYRLMSEQERIDRGAFKAFTINYYTVFAQEDIEGIEFPVHGKRRSDASPIETAQQIIDGMPNRPEIIHHTVGRAYYSPSDDHIKIPSIDYFKQDQEYYSTLFHELIHSTGHQSRLNRFSVNKEDAEGKDDYAFEELIAEMGASYLNAEAGTLYYTMKNSASYLKGWQKKLEDIMKEDNKFFLKASAKAAQAADYILAKVEEPVLAGPQIDAFNIQPKKKHRGPLNPLQMAQLQDAIKAGRTPKVNLKAKMNAKPKAAPLFEEPVIDPKQTSLFGSKAHAQYKFKEIELGPYKKDFERMFTDTIVQIHGMPGHGKTVWMLKFAQYRAEQGEHVLYVAREEFGRSVFAMKLSEHNIGHKNLRFTRLLTAEDLQWASVVFLDSVSALKLDVEDVEELSLQYANRNWILILQSTKAGDFRGANTWEHLVDVAGEIRNRKLILRKNRLDPNNSAKREKLLETDAIAEAKKKAVIKNAVKASLEPK